MNNLCVGSQRYDTKCPVTLAKIESFWLTRYPAIRRTPEKRNSFEENYEKEDVPGLTRMPNPLVSQLRYALDDQIYHEKNGGLKREKVRQVMRKRHFIYIKVRRKRLHSNLVH